MAWWSGARRIELEPESDAQPSIIPSQLIIHSIAAPWSIERIEAYWAEPGISLESHFGIEYDGLAGQFIGTQTRADANNHANKRADGTGAVSVETASNTNSTDPWTPEQLVTLIQLGAWLHRTHAIPLRICRTWDDPGFGYHKLFPQWSLDGTDCPGGLRTLQFYSVVFPGIVAAVNGPATSPPSNPPPAPTHGLPGILRLTGTLL